MDGVYLKNIRQFASTLAERRRYKGIKFQIYNLRHRYAIRGHELGFPIDDMARWMGHSAEGVTKRLVQHGVNSAPIKQLIPCLYKST